ncbi:zinc metalloprotease [Streptomonospora nanhaiensis]|uniref:zinc metalloprotease n=1 Tax=Streptomonospora nanhaiensis TaxID=1323731 RepID=UPI001C394821|nr:zinc metalloprotease [Streptomonospora nanhaiensis]MBV2366668.1 zinc metalloprotease [Streptomonospora nanhaiensis]
MNQGGKAPRGTKIRKPVRTVTAWGGLLVGAAALAGVVATSAAQAQTGDHPAPPDCPPEGAAARAAEARRDDPGMLSAEQAADYDQRLREELRRQQAPAESAAGGTVPLVVHVVHAEDGTGNVGDGTVERQVNVLNKAFSGGFAGADTGFSFDLRDITRTADDAWFADFTSHAEEAKERLRRGGPETLNLYLVNMGEGVLGQATFPQEYESAPANDGVVVDYRTVPGGSRQNYNLGYTAVHETGHWLGLFHTFQNGCERPGDYVDDTPYQREQSSGCPEDSDTCPQRGADPVHNFMDYSDDPCLNNFTRGQARRMAEHWEAFRSGGRTQARPAPPEGPGAQVEPRTPDGAPAPAPEPAPAPAPPAG